MTKIAALALILTALATDARAPLCDVDDPDFGPWGPPTRFSPEPYCERFGRVPMDGLCYPIARPASLSR